MKSEDCGYPRVVVWFCWTEAPQRDYDQFLLHPSLFHMSKTLGAWIWTRNCLTVSLSFTKGLAQEPLAQLPASGQHQVLPNPVL